MACQSRSASTTAPGKVGAPYSSSVAPGQNMGLQDRIAECVTERQHDQRPVIRANGQLMQNRAGIGEQIAVAQHDAFGRPRGAGREQQHGQIVALPARRRDLLAAVPGHLQLCNRGTAFLRAEVLGAADQHWAGTARNLFPARLFQRGRQRRDERSRPAACRRTPPGIRANWTVAGRPRSRRCSRAARASIAARESAARNSQP